MDTRKTVSKSIMEKKNTNEVQEENLVKLLSQSIFAIFIIVLTVVILGITLREELIYYSEKIVKYVGYPGLFFGMLVSDSLPAFVPPDAWLMFSIVAKMDSFWVLLATITGSIIGGFVSYSIGRFLIPRFSVGRQIILKYEVKFLPYIRRYGFGAVVIAALTPIPYSWMAYTVGSFKMNPWLFFLGSLFRIPRMTIYYYAILWGWVQ